MSLKIVALLASVAGLVGIALGYYIRIVIALSKKGSMELDIKQKLFTAEEEAKKILLEAESKATETMKELRQEVKEKETNFKVSVHLG